MRVLVVHPRVQDRRRFVRVLADSGHFVAEAAEPAAALIRCRAEHPDARPRAAPRISSTG
jgi:CheY-like chemotaxis protein